MIVSYFHRWLKLGHGEENCSRTKGPEFELGCAWLWKPHYQIILLPVVLVIGKGIISNDKAPEAKLQISILLIILLGKYLLLMQDSNVWPVCKHELERTAANVDMGEL